MMYSLLLLGLLALAFIPGARRSVAQWVGMAPNSPQTATDDKAQAIGYIVQAMRAQGITLADVEIALKAAPLTEPLPATQRGTGDIAKTLFSYLGGVFILAGIGAYIGMFWDSMGSVMRIVVTLGVGFLLQTILLLALRENKYPKLILPLALIAAAIQSSGWFVLIHELFPQGNDIRKAALFVFAVMAAQQWFIFTRHRLTVFIFIALVFSYSMAGVGLDLISIHEHWIALILGASLFATAWALERTVFRALCAPGFFIGAIWFNAGLMMLAEEWSNAGWSGITGGISGLSMAYGLHRSGRYPRLATFGYFISSSVFYAGLFDLLQHTPFELLYLAVTCFMLYLCTVLRSGALLLTGILSMLGFLGYYTAEYFVDSIGWPIALILMGVAFFGVSALAIKLKKKL